MEQNKLWLMKGLNQRVRGPLSAEDIIQLIESSQAAGDELISVYPDGQWMPLSLEPVFYTCLMKKLSGEKSPPPKPDKDLSESQPVSSSTVAVDIQEVKALKLKRANKTPKKKFVYKVKSPPAKLEPADPPPSPPLIEKKFFPPGGVKWIIMGFAALGLFFFMNWNPTNSSEFIQLKSPRRGQPSLAKKEVLGLIQKSTVLYLKSHFSGYVQAQSLLVRAVEGDKKNTEAMALLCLVYLELWPFSKQDFKAQRAVSGMLRTVSRLNKTGVRSKVCPSAAAFMKGDYLRAKSLVESALNSLSSPGNQNSKIFLPVFYYLKALSLYETGDYSTMGAYLDSTRKMLPHWVKVDLLTGDMFLKQKNPAAALTVYNRILKKNPNHKPALIHAGLLEFQTFQKIDKAQKILKKALAHPDRAPDSMMAQAYLGLAQIYLKKNDLSQARAFAELAYSRNPVHPQIQALISKMGGDKNPSKIKGLQLIYEGDQLMLKQKTAEAVSYYEKAFELSRGQNARAGLKAAEGFFQLGLLEDARKWFKKSIEADPKALEPYILMSKFYIAQYDFYNAGKILRIAGRKSPGHYEIFESWAYLSLKQGAYARAVQYARRSLKLYEANVDALIILSEAYIQLGKVNEAFVFASKAKEAEPNLARVQTAYAKAFGSVYGMDAGVDYFHQLIVRHPDQLKYRMELAKYLLKDERLKEAEEAVQAVIHRQPKYKHAYLYLGRIFMEQKFFSEAYEAFLQAAVFSPIDPQPVFYMGRLYLKQKNYPSAATQFKKTLSLNALYPEVHYYLGQTAFLKGDYKTAVKEAQLESQLNPGLPAPFLLAGAAYEKLKFFKKCAEEYQKAIDQDPKHLNLYVKTARCYRLAGLLDLAAAVLAKAAGGGQADSGVRSGDPQLYKELGLIYQTKGRLAEAAEAYCYYLDLLPSAGDKKDVKRRISNLHKQLGQPLKQCGGK